MINPCDNLGDLRSLLVADHEIVKELQNISRHRETFQEFHDLEQPLYKHIVQRRFRMEPGEFTDARLLTSHRCCLLGMRFHPENYRLEAEEKHLLLQELQVSSIWNTAIKKVGFPPLSQRSYVGGDHHLGLQVTIGSQVIFHGLPFPVLYRLNQGASPTASDVLTAVCSAYLTGSSECALVYDDSEDKSIIVVVRRDPKIFEGAKKKCNALQRAFLLGKTTRCPHCKP